MKTTAKDLRTNAKRILEAVGRGQEVVITVRGRPRAKIVPFESGKRTKRIKGKDALFGIWKENPKVRNVEAYIDSLRSGRF